MVLTTEQSKSLREAAEPLVKWLNENTDPHHIAVVETNRVQLFGGVAGLPIEEFIED